MGSVYRSGGSDVRGSVEINCETDLEYDVVEFRWKLRSFARLREIASENGLPPEGDVITSPMYVDSRGGCWWLRLYPYQTRVGHEGSVSVFLHTDRPHGDGSDLYFAVTLMALDGRGDCVKDTLCGTKLHKFVLGETEETTGVERPTSNYGFYDFIDNQKLLEQALVKDEDADPAAPIEERGGGGTLNLYCRIIVYNSLVTKLHRVREEPSPPCQRLYLVA